jgi:hypothetical protein
VADLTPEVIDALVRLMTNEIDLDSLDDEALSVVGRTAKEGPALAGRVAAKLNRRGWAFARIGEAYGVHESTAYRWAQPYLKDPDDQ